MKKILSILAITALMFGGLTLAGPWQFNALAITLPPVAPIITSSNFYTCTNNYYVSTGGNDSAAGGVGTPWLTQAGAIKNLLGQYVFTITSNSATAGATYTNNGFTFTVVNTVSSSTTVTLTVASDIGIPAPSGTLTYVAGGGGNTSNLVYSAFTGGINQPGTCVIFSAGTYIASVADTPTTPWYQGNYIGYTTHGGYLGLGGTSVSPLVFKCASYQACTFQIPYTTTAATGFNAIQSFGKLNQYTFTIPSSSMVAGDVYSTPDGTNCTILSTTTSKTIVYASCTGTPDTVVSGSNTLTQVSGSGPAGPLTYSVVSGGWLGGHIVTDGISMQGVQGIWWTTAAMTTVHPGDVYQDAGGNNYTVNQNISVTGSTTLYTTASAIPVNTFTLSAPASITAGTKYTNVNGSGVTVSCTTVGTTVSSTTLLANCTGTLHNPTSTLVNAGGNLSYTASSSSTGALTWISGTGGDDATINYTAHAGALDGGTTTPGTGLAPMSDWTLINSIFNNFGAGGSGGNHLDHFIFEGNIVSNNAYSASGQFSGLSIYNNFQSDNATGYHNNISQNVMFGNEEGPSIGFSNSGTHTDGEGFIQDDSNNSQNKCTVSPTVSITASGGAIQSGTIVTGSGCTQTGGDSHGGDILYVTQAGASGGAFIITKQSGGVPSEITLYTPGTGYTTASPLATSPKYAISEGAGGTMTITVNGTGGIVTCSSSGGSGYINSNIVLITQAGGSSGECQVATNAAGVPSTWTVYNAGKGYAAASGLAVVNLADKLTLVQNNLVYNNGGSGIRIFQSNGAVVINNTGENNSMDPLGNITVGYSAGIMLSTASSNVLANNISVVNVTAQGPGNTAYSDMSLGTNQGNIEFNNLSYNGTPGNASFTRNGTDNSGTTLTGSPYNNYLGINPQFNNISLFDFTISSQFPTSDSGLATIGLSPVTNLYPTTDLVGTTINSSSITLGAYQYTTPVTPPVNNKLILY